LREGGTGVGEEELFINQSRYDLERFDCWWLRRIAEREGDCAYNRIIFDAVCLSPRAHDPSIIESDHSDDVYAFRLESGEVLDVAWEVLGAAAGREGAGDGEEDDFFVGPFCERCVWLALEGVERLGGGRYQG
jgi:hypothetical protein